MGQVRLLLINKVLHNTAAKPDVVLHFDKETLNLDAGDFGAIALEGLLSAALDNGLGLNFLRSPTGNWRLQISRLVGLPLRSSPNVFFFRRLHSEAFTQAENCP